jgi:hypothetical protein
MTEYDNRGQVSLWKPQSDHPKAPAARGLVIAHRDIHEGEQLEIALWRNTSDHPKAPLMKGKISDKYQAESQQAAAPQQSAGADFDDDVPFAQFGRGEFA